MRRLIPQIGYVVGATEVLRLPTAQSPLSRYSGIIRYVFLGAVRQNSKSLQRKYPYLKINKTIQKDSGRFVNPKVDSAIFTMQSYIAKPNESMNKRGSQNRTIINFRNPASQSSLIQYLSSVS